MNAGSLSNPIWMACPTDQGAGALAAPAFVNPMSGYRDDPIGMTLVFGAIARVVKVGMLLRPYMVDDAAAMMGRIGCPALG